MTLPIERARTRRPVTWVTIIGALLLPVVVGAILVAAFYDPAERLDNVTAAIVNDDEPVTIDDQTVPLGRQLTAGLVEGSDDLPSNLDWTITNDDDAAAGLADGTYSAVVTIPAEFSAAATSTAGDDPERAVIEVTTAPDNLVVDDAITAQITSAAASIMGQELSEVYLENVFLGFTTLGDQLGEAADGADQLASGADQLADGTAQYVDGVGQLAAGAQPLATGAAALAPGIGEIADGAAALSAGGYEAADGIDDLAGGASALSTGASDLADGLSSLADLTAQIPEIPQGVIDAADAVAANSEEIGQFVTGSAATLTALADECRAAGDTGTVCAEIIALSDETNAALPTVTEILDDSDEIAAGIAQFQDAGPQLTAALQASAAGADEIATGIGGIAGGASQAASGVREIAAGTGALGTGADEASAGAAQVADGVQQLADGAQQAADGGTALVTGSDQTADGAGELASGLHTAADEIPSYTDDEAQTLASVVADPVEADGIGSDLFGATAVPLLAGAVDRRAGHLRRPPGRDRSRAHLAVGLRAAGAAGPRARRRHRRGAGAPRRRCRADRRDIRVRRVDGVRGSVRRRGHRLRRRQPGAGGRLRRSGPLDRRPRGRARRRRGHRLDRSGMAVLARRGHADRTRLQRHGGRPDLRRERRRGPGRPHGVDAARLHRHRDRGRAAPVRPGGAPASGLTLPPRRSPVTRRR